MASDLALRAASMAALAVVFLSALGLKPSMVSLPSLLAASTSALVLAASMASLALLASSSSLALAASFSSCVKSVRASIESDLALRAASMPALAVVFLSALGLMAAIAVSPLPCSVATSALVVATSIASLAA